MKQKMFAGFVENIIPIQGRVLRPFSEALQTWIDIEVTINEKIAKEGRMNV